MWLLRFDYAASCYDPSTYSGCKHSNKKLCQGNLSFCLFGWLVWFAIRCVSFSLTMHILSMTSQDKQVEFGIPTGGGSTHLKIHCPTEPLWSAWVKFSLQLEFVLYINLASYQEWVSEETGWGEKFLQSRLIENFSAFLLLNDFWSTESSTTFSF